MAAMPSNIEHHMAHQLASSSLPSPEREHRPWPDSRQRLDFAWPAWLVALEVEGGTWAGGRHVRGRGFEADCAKYNRAAIEGWAVLRVTADMVRDGRALAAVVARFAALGWSPERVVEMG